jgi:hypothetical protein
MTDRTGKSLKLPKSESFAEAMLPRGLNEAFRFMPRLGNQGQEKDQ